MISAWIPEGAIAAANRLSRQAVAEALEQPPGPPPFAWHERDALADLFGAQGFEVELEEAEIAFTGPSAREYLEAEGDNHPAALAGRAVLEPRGEGQAVFERMLEVLEKGNEDPDGFRVTSRYVIVTARRRP